MRGEPSAVHTPALVCIDVDGTLVGSSGEVPDVVWPAAERARQAGIRLAVCSGRPGFGKARAFAQRLDPDGWHVFQNGASVVHLPTGESRSRPLPLAGVAELIARARATGRLLELYTDAEYAVEQDVNRARRHAGLLGVPFAPRSFESLGGTVVRAQWLVGHGGVRAPLSEPHEGLTLATSVSPVMPDTMFINITAKGVDKGLAVAAVAAAYGVPLERVTFVGDGQNDVSAMRLVGHPIAMANAEPEALAAARTVVGHVDEGGLVEALELAVARSA